MNDARCYTSPISDSVDEATMKALKAFDEMKEKIKRSDEALRHLDRLARSARFDYCTFMRVNLLKSYTAFSFIRYSRMKYAEADVHLLAYEDGSLLHNDLQNYVYYDGILAQIAKQLIAGKKIMLVHAINADKHKLSDAILKIDENSEPIELDNNAAQCFLFDVMLEGWLAN